MAFPPSCTECLEIQEPEPPGEIRACAGIDIPFIKDGTKQTDGRR
jgi:hypothetical protein